jgi:hypothetical protein
MTDNHFSMDWYEALRITRIKMEISLAILNSNVSPMDTRRLRRHIIQKYICVAIVVPRCGMNIHTLREVKRYLRRGGAIFLQISYSNI